MFSKGSVYAYTICLHYAFINCIACVCALCYEQEVNSISDYFSFSVLLWERARAFAWSRMFLSIDNYYDFFQANTPCIHCLHSDRKPIYIQYSYFFQSENHSVNLNSMRRNHGIVNNCSLQSVFMQMQSHIRIQSSRLVTRIVFHHSQPILSKFFSRKIIAHEYRIKMTIK